MLWLTQNPKDFVMHKCKICKKEFDKLDVIRRHNSRVHKNHHPSYNN